MPAQVAGIAFVLLLRQGSKPTAEPRKGSVYKSPTIWGRANFRYHFIRVEPTDAA
jgi:hypothetical protein